MGKKATTITLTPEDRSYLELQTRSRTIQAQTVCRARILLLKADGESINAIADKVGINRCSVMLCLKKFKDGGVENALFDAPGRGRNAEITDDEKAWIINIACQKPVDLGYSAEVWTRALLTKHINKFAEEAGYIRLSTISQSKVRTILEEADIKPNKITYYCENRDPDFDQKMHNVLLVYKQLAFQFDENGQLLPFPEDDQVVHVLSYDEKPGIQAIATTTEDLPPDENHKTISRDYEYRRLGTVSLLAGIDLQTGEAYLATVPGRYEFVFTPRHGSWLNLVEGFFSKLTRQSLKGIRVKTKEELVERIYKYFEEINESPVVYHWKYRLDEIDPSEELHVETLPLKKSS